MYICGRIAGGRTPPGLQAPKLVAEYFNIAEIYTHIYVHINYWSIIILWLNAIIKNFQRGAVGRKRYLNKSSIVSVGS